MKKGSTISLQTVLAAGASLGRYFKRYVAILFLLLVAAVYSFILLQISSLSNAQPSPGAANAQAQASATPHIDPNVIKQIQNLQDHSVNVQTLFNQARNNPFQE